MGTGLIGASIGMALRGLGWHVTGRDAEDRRTAQALAMGALDETGTDPDAAVTFVATPVSAVVRESLAVLEKVGPQAIVTDVAGVKEPIVSAIADVRFVGGHPMAGSEQEGLAGAGKEMFQGATWVLTPTDHTDPSAFTRLRAVVSSLGADVVALDPARHDSLVAVVSHVPHLAAATLMDLAADGASEHAAMLRLAAGGFRDMTRIAAGDPSIWPDICAENSGAIVGSLDRLVRALEEVRDLVSSGDRNGLLELLGRAKVARRSLPGRAPRAEDLAELKVPVPDRPGVLAEVTTTASELGVNIEDMEIAHSAEGDRGVLVVVVEWGLAETLATALASKGFRPSFRRLE